MVYLKYSLMALVIIALLQILIFVGLMIKNACEESNKGGEIPPLTPNPLLNPDGDIYIDEELDEELEEEDKLFNYCVDVVISEDMSYEAHNTVCGSINAKSEIEARNFLEIEYQGSFYVNVWYMSEAK